MKRLPTWGRCFPIQESVPHPWNLKMMTGEVLPDFTVVEVRGKRTDHNRLVSTSLFSLTDEKWDHAWNYENFSKFISSKKDGSPNKYWEPINQRTEIFPNARNRVYLAPNLEKMSKPLIEVCGFDEVCIMREDAQGFRNGMLWRYLPILEGDLDWVVCTGIDRYSATGKYEFTLMEPHETVTASVDMNRHWMPLLGPFACNPQWLRDTYKVGYDTAAHLSAFVKAWEHHENRDPKIKEVMRRSKDGDWNALPWIDAVFLWMAFWNWHLFKANPRFIAESRYLYMKIVPVKAMFGTIEKNE